MSALLRRRQEALNSAGVSGFLFLDILGGRTGRPTPSLSSLSPRGSKAKAGVSRRGYVSHQATLCIILHLNKLSPRPTLCWKSQKSEFSTNMYVDVRIGVFQEARRANAHALADAASLLTLPCSEALWKPEVLSCFLGLSTLGGGGCADALGRQAGHAGLPETLAMQTTSRKLCRNHHAVECRTPGSLRRQHRSCRISCGTGETLQQPWTAYSLTAAYFPCGLHAPVSFLTTRYEDVVKATILRLQVGSRPRGSRCPQRRFGSGCCCHLLPSVAICCPVARLPLRCQVFSMEDCPASPKRVRLATKP